LDLPLRKLDPVISIVKGNTYLKNLLNTFPE